MCTYRMKVYSSLIIFIITCLFAFSAWAESWYDYYVQAQRAFQKKDWKTAIPLYQKAIAADPEPDRQKKYGVRTVAYYPYLELGLAYLATGDFEAAYQNCQQAKQRGAAPQNDVENKCLKIVTNIFEKLQRPLPQVIPSRQQESGPGLYVSPPLPAETDQKVIYVGGMATSAHGIKEITLSVENSGTTGMNTFTMPGRKEQPFNIQVPLDSGRSILTLSAVDTQGNVTTQEFVILRHAAVVSEPVPTAPPIQQQPPTPVPTQIPAAQPTPLPTAAVDARPIITLTSAIPAETAASKLVVEGTVTDDHGVTDVSVTVRQPGRRGLLMDVPLQKRQETFQAELVLEPGQNEILIEAADTSGQRSTQTFMVSRIAAPSSESPPIAGQRPGDVYAVIIGIGDYQDERIPDLQFTVNDAQGLYDVLTDPQFGGVSKEHIQLLLNEEATDRAIKGAIGGWLSRQAQKDDTVMIYYSGHGAPEGRDTYWVTYNANIDDLYTTALNNNEISEMLARIESERVITFLDSCYSAATVHRRDRTRSIQTEIPWEKFSGKGRVTISASDGKQLSLELEEYGHGVFTYYLLEGLKGNADKSQDGVVDVDEIWNYVKNQVTDTARKAGNPQTPVLQGQLTAGIPLTLNMNVIHQQQQEQQVARKQEQLKEFLLKGAITLPQYNCAYKILKDGETNIWLEGLLSGQLDPEVFRESFECP